MKTDLYKESYDIPLDTWQEKKRNRKNITFLKEHKVSFPDCKIKAITAH